MRSRGALPFGVFDGYSKHSSTQTRPFSSMENATGLMQSGSPANSLTSNSGGTLNFATVSAGVRYGCPDPLRLSKPNSFWAITGVHRASSGNAISQRIMGDTEREGITRGAS